jgi:spore coat protein CotH
MAGIDFEYVHADLELGGESFRDVAVRYKGNGTYMDARNSEKKSFKVDLNEFVKGQKIGGLSKLNFHSNITDVAWMNESLAYALYREAGVPAPRTSYVRLEVSVPGTYDHHLLGLYTLVENPDTNWAKEHFDSKKGLILKPVTLSSSSTKAPIGRRTSKPTTRRPTSPRKRSSEWWRLPSS